MSPHARQPIDLYSVYHHDAEASTRFLGDVVDIVDRVNQTLGYEGLPSAALQCETADLYGLQRLALLYAETALDKSDWITLHRYVAQLAVADGAQSPWPWQAMDLMDFALSDYLADHPAAGDPLLHEIVAVTRQGAADAIHDVYRRSRCNLYDAIRSDRAHDGTLDDLCETVIARRPGRATEPPAAT